MKMSHIVHRLLRLWYAVCLLFRVAVSHSALDCRFDSLSPAESAGFCGWRPTDAAGAQLWRTGNAVVVDSANFVVHSDTSSAVADASAEATNRRNRFVYVQGAFGAPSEGSLESAPVVADGAAAAPKELKLTYWKVAALPTLDICVRQLASGKGGGAELSCVDEVAGPGQHQWVRRTVELPQMASGTQYTVVLRARNIFSAEDLICVDDIQLVDATNDATKSPPRTANAALAFAAGSEFRRAQPHLTSARAMEPDDPYVFDYYQRQLAAIEESDGANTASLSQADDAAASQSLIPLVASMEDNGDASSSHPDPAPIQRYRQQQQEQQPQQPPAFDVPVFPSFGEGLNPGGGSTPTGNHLWNTAPAMPATSGSPPPTSAEETPSCRAVKCSFLNNACQWRLGSTWHRTDGSITKEAYGEDHAWSARFKPPLGATLEFQLLMSENAHLIIVQEFDDDTNGGGVAAPPDAERRITLFSHRGMTMTAATMTATNGFQRFRVPLRASHRPVRLRFRAILPPADAFIAIANTRLVDGRGEEAACETLNATTERRHPVAESNDVGAKEGSTGQSATPLGSFADLFGGISSTPFPPLLLPPPPPQLATVPTTTLATTTMFNPFRPLLESGIAPIVPLRDDPQRLTAFQRNAAKRDNITDGVEDGGAPKLMSADNNEPFRQHPTTAVLSANRLFGGRQQQPRTDAADVTLKADVPGEKRRFHAMKAMSAGKPTEEGDNGGTSSRTLGSMISAIAGRQPVLEQQLRHLAQQLGFDASAVPDAHTMETLRRFLGSRLMLNSNAKSASLPTSVSPIASSSGHITKLSPLSTMTAVGQAPPPSPFDSTTGVGSGGGTETATTATTIMMSMGEAERKWLAENESIMRTQSASSPAWSAAGLSPIKPARRADAADDETDFAQIFKEEIVKRLAVNDVSRAPNALNAELLNRLAAMVVRLPPRGHSVDLPLARENLDFVFQNALSG